MENNNVPWMWRGKPVTPEDIPEDAMGYVYCITHIKAIDEETGKYYHRPYYGKKQLSSVRRLKIGIREKKNTKTRKTYKTVKKDSGWQQYWGSSDELKADVEKYGQEQFTREILCWCYSKKNLSYMEMKYQVLDDVLQNSSYNTCIGGKYWKKDVVKPVKDATEL